MFTVIDNLKEQNEKLTTSSKEFEQKLNNETMKSIENQVKVHELKTKLIR